MNDDEGNFRKEVVEDEKKAGLHADFAQSFEVLQKWLLRSFGMPPDVFKG